MLKHINQDFIYGFRINPRTEMDVLHLCERYGLEYACSGEYGEQTGAVVGVKVCLEEVVGDKVMGRGKAQPFSLEALQQAYGEAKVRLSEEVVQKLTQDYPTLTEGDEEPNLWTVSYRE